MMDRKILERVAYQVGGYCQGKFAPKEIVNVTDKDKQAISDIINDNLKG